MPSTSLATIHAGLARWAARILGFYAKTPVFQGANEREIGLLLKLAGLQPQKAGRQIGVQILQTWKNEHRIGLLRKHCAAGIQGLLFDLAIGCQPE